MVKIERSECPPDLQKDPGKFVEGDYKKDDVKSKLLTMQHGKCCYCERRIQDVPALEREVDHYIPRKHDSFKDANGKIQWHRANNWTNLLYSCRACNNTKRGKSPFNESTGEREIIDPSFPDDNPENHIDFIIDEIVVAYKAKNNSHLGQLTIEHLKLKDRIDLYKEFRNLIPEVAALFVKIASAMIEGEETEIEKAKGTLLRNMSSDCEFAGFRRRLIERKLKWFNEVVLPKLEAVHNKTFNRIDLEIPKGHFLIH